MDEFDLSVPCMELVELAAISDYPHLVDLHSLDYPDGLEVQEREPFCMFHKAAHALDLQGGGDLQMIPCPSSRVMIRPTVLAERLV